MDELERRLRAAMIGAPEAAPPRLLPSVYRRHRRHRHRLLAAYVAVAAAVLLAIPPLGHELGAASYSAHRRLAIAILISVLGDYSGDNCQ